MADFGVEDSEVLGEGPLLYGDFMVPNTDNKIYEEITDQQKVSLKYVVLNTSGLKKVLTFSTSACTSMLSMLCM